MEKISIYRKKLSKKKEIELRQDVIIPDTKQDIVTVLDGNFFCYFSKIETIEGRIKVNGNIDSYITYISSNEETVGLQSNLYFDDMIENKIITENMHLKYKLEIKKQEIKIVNERKISMALTVQILYEVYGVDEIELWNDVSSLEDIQVASQKVNLYSLIGINSNLASLKEEIKVDGNDSIAEILRIETNIVNKEVKISYHKILTKADLQVRILYLTKEGRVGKAEDKFPIMSFIVLENVKEENVCSTDYQIRNMLLNTNGGDENSITIQMEYEIICQAFENREQEIVSDVYSLKYRTEMISKEIAIGMENPENEKEKIDINEKVNLEDEARVIDVLGKCRMIKNSEGEIELKIYYESNHHSGLNIKTITLPVVHKKLDDQSDLILSQIEFEFHAPVLTIQGNMMIEERNVQEQVIHVVQKVEQQELLEEQEYGMIVYSIKKNDTLWDIAKRFRVKQESIIHSNELEEPYQLNSGEKIYIIR